MPRRSALLSLLLGLLLLPGAALADTATDTAADGPVTTAAADLVLAVDGAPAGPDPAPRLREDNPARELGDYDDREIPFTWGAAWLLAGLGFIGIALLLLIYRFRVVGPERAKASS